MPSKHWRICAEHFTEDGFKQNIAIRSFVGTLFQASSTSTRERCGPTIFNFPMESCKLAIGHKKKTKKNKQFKPAEQQVNSLAISQINTVCI